MIIRGRGGCGGGWGLFFVYDRVDENWYRFGSLPEISFF